MRRFLIGILAVGLAAGSTVAIYMRWQVVEHNAQTAPNELPAAVPERFVNERDMPQTAALEALFEAPEDDLLHPEGEGEKPLREGRIPADKGG